MYESISCFLKLFSTHSSAIIFKQNNNGAKTACKMLIKLIRSTKILMKLDLRRLLRLRIAFVVKSTRYLRLNNHI